MTERVLLVDDDQSLLEVMRFHLEEEGFDIRTAGDGEEALAAFIERPVPVVVTDLKMPRMGGMELLSRILERAPDTLVIVITAFGDVDSAVKAMKAGAYEFLPKPCDRDHFKLTIRRAFDHARLRREVSELRGRLGSEGKDLLFSSRAMEEVVRVADRVAASEATVLVLGESGTGKELLARRIHRQSERRDKPFVAVNCGAIPRELLEDELFGHVKGAFTGATKDRKGRFLQASGGTLFLDEIGELPAELQSRLLRALQERTIDVVGSDAPVPVDVRVIAASNRDLEAAVRDGSFREDLFYRVNVMPIRIPPLRERREDILPLVKNFLARHSGREDWTVSAEFARRMEAHPWRGNVRELENFCQRLTLLTDARELRADDAPGGARDGRGAVAVIGPERIDLPPEGASLEDLERAIIERALELNNHNQSRAARFLRIPRHVLLYRLEKFGIDAKGTKTDVPPRE